MVEFDAELVREAKAIVALALKDGPIEDLCLGVACPTCSGDGGYRHLTNVELKAITKAAVSRVFRLLWLRDNDPQEYQRQVRTAGAIPGCLDDEC